MLSEMSGGALCMCLYLSSLNNHRWMDGLMGGWMEGGNGWMEAGWVERWVDGWEGQMDVWIDAWVDGQVAIPSGGSVVSNNVIIFLQKDTS